jgi:predicted transcriptional regulator of viral defense system
MTVKSAVLQVLDAVPRTQAETLALVEALGTSTTPGSLSVLLGKMVSRGEIDRPSRGRYTVTQE